MTNEDRARALLLAHRAPHLAEDGAERLAFARGDFYRVPRVGEGNRSMGGAPTAVVTRAPGARQAGIGRFGRRSLGSSAALHSVLTGKLLLSFLSTHCNGS